MNLFIFGAGASYGSDTNKSFVPPLAADLFNNLARQYSDISGNSIAMSLASEFSKDFEQGLLKLYGKQPQFWSILQRCMAHFFFQYNGINIQIRDSNLYYRLAQEIKKSDKHISVATLNYERLLEITFSHVGIPLVCGNSTIAP